ncbi:transglutaminase family protein [Rubellimicrobium sp. CFH 75288]|uniref:transglutaminase-like domain-containing protein n=1 Tax=Rubellimicrobium sp. CFH 75288 TaxID=2697034 RepID=UPI001411E48E|nr:transglutaminase family protein [Rubellimicrobium sp. CFH 75288]NAZ38119.1 transglutaminase family protein [Rubellimicrobium sp. CFH 75288]
MLIRIGFDIAVAVEAPTPAILALSPRPEELARIAAEPLKPEPPVPMETFQDDFGNTRCRLVLPPGTTRLVWNGMATDSGQPDPVVPEAVQHPVEDLPPETLPFLMPSRYCESDLLMQEAWDRFGAIADGWARVQAICDFAHETIRFDYAAASTERTASTSLRDGSGVCRDYAHMVIAFARALNIPARYASGWLGDIEWPDMGPGDFCAWTEVYLGGRWYVFDARYNVPRIGRITMVRGRDAADVPMLTTFGASRLERFAVFCDEVPPQLEAAE